MEIAKVELAALAQTVGKTVGKSESPEIVELAELQLALIGGGVGDVILV